MGALEASIYGLTWAKKSGDMVGQPSLTQMGAG